MIRRPHAELASHLHKRRTAGLQHVAHRGECLMGIGPAEVLDDTIGKHAIKTPRLERKESRVGTNEICCKSDLRCGFTGIILYPCACMYAETPWLGRIGLSDSPTTAIVFVCDNKDRKSTRLNSS